jgi:hypothetical protein
MWEILKVNLHFSFKTKHFMKTAELIGVGRMLEKLEMLGYISA